MKELLSQFGELRKIRLPKKIGNEHRYWFINFRGFCFAEYVSKEEATAALEALQGTHFYGRKLVLEYANETSLVWEFELFIYVIKRTKSPLQNISWYSFYQRS